MLGYRLYRDLRRGWRITSPNLEQCGLLEIGYQSLDEVCAGTRSCGKAATRPWPAPPARRACTIAQSAARLHAPRAGDQGRLPATGPFQERLQQQSSQRLESRRGRSTRTKRTRARAASSSRAPRGRGRLSAATSTCRRAAASASTCAARPRSPASRPRSDTAGDRESSAGTCSQVLRVAGLVARVSRIRERNRRPRLPAAGRRRCVWMAGDGTQRLPRPDPRSPGRRRSGGRTNPFFVDFYRTIAGRAARAWRRASTPPRCPTSCARTAKTGFRRAALPILFCSPTMELGVDIAELNVGEHAQRAADAGQLRPAQRPRRPQRPAGAGLHLLHHRQPARPVLLPAPGADGRGQRSRRRASTWPTRTWCAPTSTPSGWPRPGLSLGSSLKDVLDLAGDKPIARLLLDCVSRFSIDAESPRERAQRAVERVLATLAAELAQTPTGTARRWLDEVLKQVALQLRPGLRPLARPLPRGA